MPIPGYTPPAPPGSTTPPATTPGTTTPGTTPAGNPWWQALMRLFGAGDDFANFQEWLKAHPSGVGGWARTHPGAPAGATPGYFGGQQGMGWRQLMRASLPDPNDPQYQPPGYATTPGGPDTPVDWRSWRRPPASSQSNFGLGGGGTAGYGSGTGTTAAAPAATAPASAPSSWSSFLSTYFGGR